MNNLSCFTKKLSNLATRSRKFFFKKETFKIIIYYKMNNADKSKT